jgi:NDP-sugar pyrophosphorylase family protein
MVNAGIYVLSPQVLDKVPAGEYLDMPTLFQRLVDAGCMTRCHPITGYWLDIGRLGDYERANNEFGDQFR